ncbi:MAG: MFS transporter [Marmoricola sp.]
MVSPDDVSAASNPPADPAPPFARDRLARGWLGVRALSDAGDSIWTIALAWTAVQIGSPAAAGAVVAAGTIPRAAVLLVGGVVADRYDARRVMIVANLVRIAVLVAVTVRVALGGPSLPVLVAAAVAFGLSDAVYEPSASTIGRQLVRTNDLASYTGLSQTLSRVGTMSGSAAGGFVVAAWGLDGSAGLDAVTFVGVVVFLLVRLRPRYPMPRAEVEPVLRSIGRGFAHLRVAPLTRTLVVALSGLNLFVGPAFGIGLAIAAKQEGWGATSVGIFVALDAGGAALGSLTMMRWRPRQEATAAFGWLVIQGVAIVALGLGSPVVTGIASALVGVTAGAASTLLSAVFVATVDGAFLGRMAALQRLGDDVFMPAAMAGFGALTSATSVTTAFASYGGAMALLMLWPLSNRALRAVTLRCD